MLFYPIQNPSSSSGHMFHENNETWKGANGIIALIYTYMIIAYFLYGFYKMFYITEAVICNHSESSISDLVLLNAFYYFSPII